MSSIGPQNPQQVKKMHKRYPRSSGPRFSTDPLNVLNFLKRSSKPPKSTEVRGPQNVFKATSNSSKSYQRPQNPVIVKSSSNGHQVVLTKSSTFPKNSPQKFHQKSSKVPERFSNVLRASGPQVFKMPSKGPQSHQKVKKMHKRYPRSSGLRFSTDPQNILNFLQRWSKPLEVRRGPQKVFKATSNSSKSYQRPQNPVIVKSSSNGHQMVPTKSSKFPKNSPQNVPKKSSKVPQRFFNVLKKASVLSSSKSPQKFHKIHNKPRKCTKGTQGPRSPQVLNWSSNCLLKVKKMHKRYPTSSGLGSSNDPQITQKVLKILEILKGPQKILKSSSKSSKIYQRP